MRVDRHWSQSKKHRDFLVCPGTTISSKTKPKIIIEIITFLNKMYSFQNADWMSFSVEILEHFQTAGYLVF